VANHVNAGLNLASYVTDRPKKLTNERLILAVEHFLYRAAQVVLGVPESLSDA